MDRQETSFHSRQTVGLFHSYWKRPTPMFRPAGFAGELEESMRTRVRWIGVVLAGLASTIVIAGPGAIALAETPTAAAGAPSAATTEPEPTADSTGPTEPD